MNRKPFRVTMVSLVLLTLCAWVIGSLGVSSVVMADGSGGGVDPPIGMNADTNDTTNQGSGEASEDDGTIMQDAVDLILDLFV